MNHIKLFEQFVDGDGKLTIEEYRKYYPVLGYKGAGLEFNFDGQSVGGYVVPKAGERIEDLIDMIEMSTGNELTAIPYEGQVGQFAAGIGNDNWMKTGTAIRLQVIKK